MEERIPEGALTKVGDEWILQSDLDFFLSQNPLVVPSAALERLTIECALAEAAKEEGIDEGSEMRAARRRMLSSRYLIQFEAESPREPSEAELRERWQEQEEKWMIPARVKIACLQISNEETYQAARKGFLELLPDPKRKGFGTLAAKYSQEPNTRYQGGEFGWIDEGQSHVILPDEIVSIAFEHEEGLVETQIEAEGSLWMVLVQKRQEKKVKSFKSVSGLIALELREEKARRRKDMAISDVMRAIQIQEFKSPQGLEMKVEKIESVPSLPR